MCRHAPHRRGRTMTDKEKMTDEELLQIIKQAAEEQWTELDLSGKGLASLPAEIGKLTRLVKLHLRENQLTTLPPELGLLTNLQSLNLNYNHLSSLPPEIGRLTRLKRLDIFHNRLRALPS